ncbi:MAG TPA: efflux RND transporter periplasmic adaptor subunit, partial [Syntrophales bacterium]|nr:efflux RND transporter periplasmic adaptor subunit [Syntrophales bacterium]
VSTVDPIKVYFQLSEQEYIQAVKRSTESRESKKADLILADGSVYPEKGRFAFADRQVDITTGTIKVAALFPNPGNFLRPGQYGKIRVATAVRKGALLVPQRAIAEIQGKYMAAVVGADRKVDIRSVKPAERVDDLWVILEGLKPGEQVVVEGIQKVRPGMPVTPKMFAQEAVKPGETPEKKTKSETAVPPYAPQKKPAAAPVGKR